MKILRITASWCPECAIMGFRWQEIKKEFPQLAIEEVDFDKQQELKQKYQIDKASTFIFFDQQGQELLRRHGLLETKELIQLIKENQNK
ncbi:MAG: thioredoxin family protein [Patescibacteria group bacterium]